MHPIELDAILKLAKTKLRSGQIPEAEAMYRRVLQEQPECAEAIHFLGLAAMMRGKLDEALTLVRRSVELDASRCEYHNNLATVLGHKNLAIEALGAAQRAIELKEDCPEAHGNKGIALERLGRLDEAIDSYRQAIEHREDYVEGLLNLGNALSRKGDHEEAIARLKRAAELRPRDGNLRKHLGNAHRKAGKPELAVTAYRMAVELNPKDADAYNNLGAALQESGKVREAEQVLRTCLSINSNHTDAHWNLGLALLALGDWRQGWIEYEWRRHLREDLGQKRGFPQPAWNGSPIEGRTVLVMCEQGLGDTIQFIRYVPLLAARGAKVIVECQSKLRPLLMGLVGGDAGTRGHGDAGKEGAGEVPWKVIARGEPLPNFDVHARLMTLPGIFGSTPEEVPNRVPYLSVDEERVERWHEELRGGEGASGGGGERSDPDGLPLTPSPPRPLSPSLRPSASASSGRAARPTRGTGSGRFRWNCSNPCRKSPACNWSACKRATARSRSKKFATRWRSWNGATRATPPPRHYSTPRR